MTAPTAPKSTTKTEPAAEPEYATELTSRDLTESLTGYDELTIEAHLGKAIEEIGSNYTLLRALAAIHLTREGAKEGVAWGKAMGMPASELKKYFTPMDNDPMPEASESGKDAPPA